MWCDAPGAVPHVCGQQCFLQKWGLQKRLCTSRVYEPGPCGVVGSAAATSRFMRCHRLLLEYRFSSQRQCASPRAHAVSLVEKTHVSGLGAAHEPSSSSGESGIASQCAFTPHKKNRSRTCRLPEIDRTLALRCVAASS